MSIVWTKTWSASDDGTILTGSDLQNLQNNIEAYTMQLSGAQTVAGDKIFSGDNTINVSILKVNGVVVSPSGNELNQLDGVTDLVASANEFCCWEDTLVGYEGNLIYYR